MLKKAGPKPARCYLKARRVPMLATAQAVAVIALRLIGGILISLPSANRTGATTSTIGTIGSLVVALLGVASLESQTDGFELIPTPRARRLAEAHCVLLLVVPASIIQVVWLDAADHREFLSSEFHLAVWLGLAAASAVILGVRRSWVVPLIALVFASWSGVSPTGQPTKWNLIFARPQRGREVMWAAACALLLLALLARRTTSRTLAGAR